MYATPLFDVHKNNINRDVNFWVRIYFLKNFYKNIDGANYIKYIEINASNIVV